MMTAEELLRLHGQERLLPLADKLPPEGKERLQRQLESLDWELLELIKRPEDLSGGELSPIEGMGREEIEARRAEFEEIGGRAVGGGKVAAVLLAGGQGTRLGCDGPKGVYDIGVTRPLPIFEQLFCNLRETTSRYGALPFLVMTSEKNDRETRAFFEERNYFGYPQAMIRFFRQEMAPAVDFCGDLLMEEDGLALSPNGNGGWYSSLMRAGVMKDFPAVEWYNVFAVDNVLQRIADPVFVGATIASGKLCGAKTVEKTEPDERVGVLCLSGGKPAVVEYYELPPEAAALRGGDGRLVYRYGVILNYLFHAGRLEEIARERIPVHIVKKKIPYLTEGGMVHPAEENGYKFETLILDMVKLMGSCLPFETEREREFAPVKNLTGKDSVETARALLEKNGVKL